MKRVLITGANGFVGSCLCKFLHGQGDEITALVRDTSNCSLIPSYTKQNKTDYTQEDLNSAFEGQDVIIHCAGVVRARNWEDYFKANVEITKRVIQAYLRNNANKHLVFLSSQAAAGMAKVGSNKLESDPCIPISDYGRSKRMAEHLIMDECKKPWTIIRPSSVYGPGDKDFLPFFKAVEHHLSVHIGKKDKKISFIYVKELAELISKVLEAKASHYQIFFASDGMIYNQSDFIDSLQQVIPSWTMQLQIPDLLLMPIAAFSELGGYFSRKAPVLNWQKKNEIKGRNWVVSIDKAKDLLRFEPKPNLVSNLQETYRWYKDKGWL